MSEIIYDSVKHELRRKQYNVFHDAMYSRYNRDTSHIKDYVMDVNNKINEAMAALNLNETDLTLKSRSNLIIHLVQTRYTNELINIIAHPDDGELLRVFVCYLEDKIKIRVSVKFNNLINRVYKGYGGLFTVQCYTYDKYPNELPANFDGKSKQTIVCTKINNWIYNNYAARQEIDLKKYEEEISTNIKNIATKYFQTHEYKDVENAINRAIDESSAGITNTFKHIIAKVNKFLQYKDN